MKDREYPRVSPELLQSAAERIRNACYPLSEDPDIRKSQEEYLSFKTGYDLRVKVQQSYNEGFEEGFKIGLAKSRAKGLAEGRAETARAMLADGVDPVRITKYTGLSAEELEALKVLK